MTVDIAIHVPRLFLGHEFEHRTDRRQGWHHSVSLILVRYRALGGEDWWMTSRLLMESNLHYTLTAKMSRSSGSFKEVWPYLLGGTGRRGGRGRGTIEHVSTMWFIQQWTKNDHLVGRFKCRTTWRERWYRWSVMVGNARMILAPLFSH